MSDSAAQTEGGLPLQFALAELWELRDQERKLIPAHALRDIGGVSGALARHADDILRQLSPAEHNGAFDSSNGLSRLLGRARHVIRKT